MNLGLMLICKARPKVTSATSFSNAAEPVNFTLNSSNVVLFEVWNHVFRNDLSLYDEQDLRL
jgi:hypothetical protein